MSGFSSQILPYSLKTKQNKKQLTERCDLTTQPSCVISVKSGCVWRRRGEGTKKMPRRGDVARLWQRVWRRPLIITARLMSDKAVCVIKLFPSHAISAARWVSCCGFTASEKDSFLFLLKDASLSLCLKKNNAKKKHGACDKSLHQCGRFSKQGTTHKSIWEKASQIVLGSCVNTPLYAAFYSVFFSFRGVSWVARLAKGWEWSQPANWVNLWHPFIKWHFDFFLFVSAITLFTSYILEHQHLPLSTSTDSTDWSKPSSN